MGKQKFLPMVLETTRNTLTPSQQAIMELLTKSINEKRPVSREAIVDAYTTTLHPSGETTIRYETYNWEQRKYEKVAKKVVVKEDWRTAQKAISWFKNNLATCIIKGRILILPVIEIE